MRHKTYGYLLLLPLLMTLAGCWNSDSDEAPAVPENEPAQTENETPQGKIDAEADQLSYQGAAKFVAEKESYPCSDYAMESDICTADPNGTVSVERFYLQLPQNDIHSELLSTLDQASEPMVKKNEEGYLINLGCKNDNQIQGDLYGPYENDKINAAFESGSTHAVSFVLDRNQPERGDTGCPSLITEFKSIQ